jgi:Rieske Fe-S protein
MEGLKFKPPKDAGASTNTKSTSGSTSNPAASKSSNPSASGTSTASPSSNDTNKSQPVPSEYEEEGSDEDYNDYRNLSKSERKKMRRQQNDRGAA